MEESEWEEIVIGNLSTKFKLKFYLQSQMEKMEEGSSGVKHVITSIAGHPARKIPRSLSPSQSPPNLKPA